ncbi:MAG: hypothetical protein WDW38_003835 [Sanguina aurantia]
MTPFPPTRSNALKSSLPSTLRVRTTTPHEPNTGFDAISPHRPHSPHSSRRLSGNLAERPAPGPVSATVVSCNPCIAAPLPATTATTFTPLILGNHTVNLAPIITIALPTADATSSETASTKSTNSQTTTTPRPISAQAPAPSSSVSAT